MDPHRALAAEETMTFESEQLSNARPVRVLTHLFEHADGTPPVVSGIEDLICGTGHLIERRHEVAAHDHMHYEISVVIHGRALHRTAMYESVLEPGAVFIVSPGKVHGVYEIDGLCLVNCCYLTEWLLSDIREIWAMEGLIPLFLAAGLLGHPQNPWVPQYTLDDEAFQACIRELRDIGREWERGEQSHLYMKCCIEKLMLTLGRAYVQSGMDDPRPAMGSHVRDAIQYIEENVANCERLCVSELADRVGMSSDYFSRVFKDVTGWSPMDYFQRRRIQQASWLLINSSHSATEVAHSLGFFDSAHFSRLFKRHQGLSPRAYRKRYSKGSAGD